jgi:hypothetical protein
VPLPLPRVNLTEWAGRNAVALQPLVERLRERLLEQPGGQSCPRLPGRLARASDDRRLQRHRQGKRLHLKRWDTYCCYADSGHLPLDNNPIENCIRPLVLGKKNWLFAGPERGNLAEGHAGKAAYLAPQPDR